MLRTEQRRLERRRTARHRWIASITAVAVALGLAVGGTAVATANPNATLSTPVSIAGGVTTYDQNGLTCNSDLIGFTKPRALDGSNLNTDGSYSAAWGTISWDVSERTVTWSIVPGWDVDVCVKGGTYLSTIDTSVSEATSYTLTYAGLSHLGFRINTAQPTNDLDCKVATNYPGRALTNGDHINMDIVQGDQKFQVTASVDIRQSQDPVSESGLVLRVNAPGGPYTLPISTEQKKSGILSFPYATYLTDSFTVEWVQFNSTYFNQDRDVAEFLACGEGDTVDEVVTPAARSLPLGCEAAGSYTLDAGQGIRWFVGLEELPAGTTVVTAPLSITVRAEAVTPGYVIDAGTQSTWTFTFERPVDCELPELPTTDASIGFIAPTCELGQQLDPTKFLVVDAELARYAPELSTLTGPTYAVVFVTIDEDARFYDSSTPVSGRTVSNGGTTLTFTGTLLGPDPEECEVLPIVDPFDFVDTCAARSFTLDSIEGITYWVTINNEAPFAAVFGLDEDSRTYLVQQGDRVSVMPTANSGYVLAPDQPTPLNRQFTVYGPDDCQLPELPNWPASVTVADQVCTTLGLTDGSLTVQLSTGPEANPTPVRYYVAYGTPQQRELSSAVTPLDPGSYVVTAVATVSTDSINDSGNTAEFPVTIDPAADQECDLPTLAFTGATSALAGLGAASLLFVLVGFGIMIARRQRA